MEKKYELLTNKTIQVDGHTLYRIRALRDVGIVKAGSIGGYVESEDNLSQFDNCWVYNDAKVYENASVYNNAEVCNQASVRGNARVYDEARVDSNATVDGCAVVHGRALVTNSAFVYEHAEVYESAYVAGNSRVFGSANVFGKAQVAGYCRLFGAAYIGCDASLGDTCDYLTICPIGSEEGVLTAWRDAMKGIMVSRGCFIGTLTEFENKVKARHGDNIHSIVYGHAIAMIKAALA